MPRSLLAPLLCERKKMLRLAVMLFLAHHHASMWSGAQARFNPLCATEGLTHPRFFPVCGLGLSADVMRAFRDNFLRRDGTSILHARLLPPINNSLNATWFLPLRALHTNFKPHSAACIFPCGGGWQAKPSCSAVFEIGEYVLPRRCYIYRGEKEKRENGTMRQTNASKKPYLGFESEGINR